MKRIVTGACAIALSLPALGLASAQVVSGTVAPDATISIDGGRLTKHAADPDHGYAWPYLLVTPAAGAPRPLGAGTLLVAPNNTGESSEDIEFVTASATRSLTNPKDINALELADRLGTPLLVPLFPRPKLPTKLPEDPPDLYLHALTRASLEAKAEPFKRVDLQLIAMIKAARAVLATKDKPVQSRVLIAGLSAAGSFTNRFTVLHPNRVLAAAAVSPGGWPIAPVAIDRDDELRYPVGIADVKGLTGHEVDLEALRRVSLLFLLGDHDSSDAVPNPDSFSAADMELINRRFGGTPIERWGFAQRLYRAARMDAQFKTYPGVGHWVTPEMREDIVDTFRAVLSTHCGQC